MKRFLLVVLSFTIATSHLAAHAMAWTEQQVSIDGLHGTLIPADISKNAVTVLMWAGSGPVDRDGNLPGLHNDSLKLLAHELAKLGIGSLRTDKRGVGESRAAGPREEDMRLDIYVEDAVAWLRFLRQRQDTGHIFVVGHSEGALIGTLAAQKEKISGLILIAGAGESAAKTIARQLAAASVPAVLQEESKKISDSLARGVRVAGIPPQLAALYRPSVQSYMMSWLRIDPALELARVKCPVLIVQGTTDLQVGTNDAQLLASAQPAAKLVLVPGMNHVLKEAPADRTQNLATYRDPQAPLAPALVPTLAEFLRAHLRQ